MLQSENLFYYYLSACLVLVVVYIWHRWRFKRTYEKKLVYNRTSGADFLGQKPDHSPPRRLRRDIAKLIKVNQIDAAARLFESNGFAEQAADLLAKHGLFNDALKTYLRSQNLHGAGILLARLGKFNEALPHFERSKSYSDAAMCAVQMHQWDRAARYFALCHRFTEAIHCYCKQGDFDAALELSKESADDNQYSEVFAAYAQAQPKAFANIEFSEEDIRKMARAVTDGSAPKGYILALDIKIGMQELILDCIRNRKDDMAELFCTVLATRQIYKRLVDEASYVDQTGALTANFLLRINQLELAAEGFIRCQSFSKASIVFEKCGDYKRAIDSALSAQDWERADKLRKSLLEKDQEAAAKAEQQAKNGINKSVGIFALNQTDSKPMVDGNDDIKLDIDDNNSTSDQVFKINLNSHKTGS